MSLSSLIGPFDMPAAIMVGVIAVALAIISTSSILKRRSRRELDQAFELAKIKEANSAALAVKQQNDATAIAGRKIDANVAIERERIGQNLITSHEREPNKEAALFRD